MPDTHPATAPLATRGAAALAAAGLFFVGIMLGAVSRNSDADAVLAPTEARSDDRGDAVASDPSDDPADGPAEAVSCAVLNDVAIGNVDGTERTGGSVHSLGSPVGPVPVVVELLAEPSKELTATAEGSPWLDGTLLMIRPEGVRSEVWEWVPDPNATGADLEPVDHSGFIAALVDTYATEANCGDTDFVVIDGANSGADLALRHVCDQATSTGLVILRDPNLGLDADLTCVEAVDVMVITSSQPDDAVVAGLESIAAGLARCPELVVVAPGELPEASNCTARFGYAPAPVREGFELALLSAWLDGCPPTADPDITRWCESSS